MATEKLGVDDTAEVLAVFAGAAHARRRHPIRLAAGCVAVAFTIVSLGVVATHDRGQGGDGDVSVLGAAPTSGDAPSGAPGGAPTVPSPSDQVSSVLGPLAPELGLTPDDLSSFGSDVTADGTGGAAGPSSGSTVTTVAGPPHVAVVSPTLKVFAFGSKVGLPLLCNVAFSAVIAQVPDPNLAQVATTIVTSCVDGGNQGGAALETLNEQLRALEAINPAVAPFVDALAGIFNTAGAPGIPFAESLQALGSLISYFSGPLA